jgi:DNA-binding CsgD family transcriptional regulator
VCCRRPGGADPGIEERQALLEVQGRGQGVRSAAQAPQRTAAPQSGGDTSTPAVVLTARQREALHLAAAGWSDEQIGARWGISARTVAVHLRRAADRIGVTYRADAVGWLRARSGEDS